MTSFPKKLTHKLLQSKEKLLFRSLKTIYPLIDFSSNDYLGFSSQGLLDEEIKLIDKSIRVGSTGSRLISGNSSFFEEIESNIAKFHNSQSTLLFNSGYDANVGLLSSVPQKGDLILSDELMHASLIDGIRLSFATHYKFKHNNVDHLIELVNRFKDDFDEIYVVVESVYSMDGTGIALEFRYTAAYLKAVNALDPATVPVKGEVTPEVTPEVERLLSAFTGEHSRRELQEKLGLQDDDHMRIAYIRGALAAGLIERTLPDKPNSRLQKYRLTAKRRAWLAQQRR